MNFRYSFNLIILRRLRYIDHKHLLAELDGDTRRLKSYNRVFADAASQGAIVRCRINLTTNVWDSAFDLANEVERQTSHYILPLSTQIYRHRFGSSRTAKRKKRRTAIRPLDEERFAATRIRQPPAPLTEAIPPVQGTELSAFKSPDAICRFGRMNPAEPQADTPADIPPDTHTEIPVDVATSNVKSTIQEALELLEYLSDELRQLRNLE